MDKLLEFLTGKIGYTISVILGFLLPGMLFIFVWNRSVYFELGIIRLLILALCVSFAIYVCNSLCFCYYFMLQEKWLNKKVEISDILSFPLFITNLEIYLSLVYKLYNSSFTIYRLAKLVILIAIAIGTYGVISTLLTLLLQKIRKHKK